MLGEKMKEEDKKKIQEIMSVLKCEKNFKCADSGFEILCKAKDIGVDNYLECLESDPLRSSLPGPATTHEFS